MNDKMVALRHNISKLIEAKIKHYKIDEGTIILDQDYTFYGEIFDEKYDLPKDIRFKINKNDILYYIQNHTDGGDWFNEYIRLNKSHTIAYAKFNLFHFKNIFIKFDWDTQDFSICYNIDFVCVHDYKFKETIEPEIDINDDIWLSKTKDNSTEVSVIDELNSEMIELRGVIIDLINKRDNYYDDEIMIDRNYTKDGEDYNYNIHGNFKKSDLYNISNETIKYYIMHHTDDVNEKHIKQDSNIPITFELFDINNAVIVYKNYEYKIEYNLPIDFIKIDYKYVKPKNEQIKTHIMYYNDMNSMIETLDQIGITGETVPFQIKQQDLTKNIFDGEIASATIGETKYYIKQKDWWE